MTGNENGGPLTEGMGAVVWGVVLIVVAGIILVCAAVKATAAAPMLTVDQNDGNNLVLTAAWNQAIDTEPSSGCCRYVLEIYRNGKDDRYAMAPVADTTFSFIWTNPDWAYLRVMAIDSLGQSSEWSRWAVYCPFDINSDGIVDIDDMTILRRHYGAVMNGKKWDASLDFNSDGIIDVDDGQLLRKNYGRMVEK